MSRKLNKKISFLFHIIRFICKKGIDKRKSLWYNNIRCEVQNKSAEHGMGA